MVRTQPFPLQWGLMKVMNFKFNLNKKKLLNASAGVTSPYS